MAAKLNVVFWGAGATASLGMRTTEQQGAFVAALSGADDDTGTKSLDTRVSSALGMPARPLWNGALHDLVTILGDTDAARTSIHVINADHLEAMRRHWKPGAAEGELRKRIMALRLMYDWPALKDAVRICPGVRSSSFRINDLFNLLDLHAPLGHGFRAEEGRFLDARRLIGAKAALKMLLHAMFYIDYQVCIAERRPKLQSYRGFAEWLGRRVRHQRVTAAAGFDRPEFIRGDVAFVSLNYDPIGLWTQFVANRDLNTSPPAPIAGSHAARVELFHNLGHFIPSRRIEPSGRPALWYPMNEASAQRLNEAGSRVCLTKFLFPHGCLCWRECPDCGKLSAYHGDEWDLGSPSLIPPPPLKGFEQRPAYPDITSLNDADQEARKLEKAKWEDGQVDERACLHCGTLTSTQHTQTVMQSSFKQAPPSFIDEIQRDLRALVMRADHIVLMGYSLPADDVSYRSFFAARQRRSKPPVQCTVVNFDPKGGWAGPDAADLASHPLGSVVRNAIDIFGEGNVRYCGDGVPGAFLDATGAVSDAAIEKVVIWPFP